jgi:hypothetical protein
MNDATSEQLPLTLVEPCRFDPPQLTWVDALRLYCNVCV